MRPSDPDAVAKRFAAVVARGLEKAEKGLAAYAALWGEVELHDESPTKLDDLQHPWDKRQTNLPRRHLTRAQARRIIRNLQQAGSRRTTQASSVTA